MLRRAGIFSCPRQVIPKGYVGDIQQVSPARSCTPKAAAALILCQNPGLPSTLLAADYVGRKVAGIVRA